MHPEPNRRPSAVAISGIAATELAALATEGTIKGTGADSEAEAGGAIAAIDLFPSHAINIISGVSRAESGFGLGPEKPSIVAEFMPFSSHRRV